MKRNNDDWELIREEIEIEADAQRIERRMYENQVFLNLFPKRWHGKNPKYRNAGNWHSCPCFLVVCSLSSNFKIITNPDRDHPGPLRRTFLTSTVFDIDLLQSTVFNLIK